MWGAVVAGLAIFVPSFVLLLSLLPLLAHLERVAWLTAARQGMSPAIIGMIAVALLKLLPTAVSGLVPLMTVGAAIGAIGVLWGAG
jgi:chromate transporter